jgi:hypothetical protein
MVFALHKFRHYLLGNKFVFYVDHMALVYLVNKPQVSRIITRWLLLFLEYDFTVVYKLSRTHVVANVILISKLHMMNKLLNDNCRSEEWVFFNMMDHEIQNEEIWDSKIDSWCIEGID